MNWPDDFIDKIICGDSLSVIKKMPHGSVDMVITSPPYWGLRDYGFEQIFGGDKNCEHRWGSSQIEHDALRYRGHNANVGSNKNPEIHPGKEGSGGQDCIFCGAWKGQLGLEPTPELYIEHLTEIFNEAKRVLKKEGTLWLNIGDTYCSDSTVRTAGIDGFLRKGDDGYDAYLASERHAGKSTKKRRTFKYKNLPAKCLMMIPERLAWSLIQNGWILRNKIIWYKPNAMPSSVTDRFSNRWEYIFLFSKSQRYYFDLDAVRKPHAYLEIEQRRSDFYDKVHYGGQQIDKREKNRFDRKRSEDFNPLGKNPGDVFEINTQPFPEAHFAVFPEKLCEKPIKAGCPEGGVVLDPFCGVGTALYVAKELRRRYIGIDIKKKYCELAEKRLAQGVL